VVVAVVAAATAAVVVELLEKYYYDSHFPPRHESQWHKRPRRVRLESDTGSHDAGQTLLVRRRIRLLLLGADQMILAFCLVWCDGSCLV
jgi:hypothetical protein